MKKIYKIAISVIITLLILLVLAPFLFQDKIITLVKKTVNNNITAQLDFTDANLSLLRDFPNASLQLSNVSIINGRPFKGDTLLFSKEINLELKLTELLKNSSEKLNIQYFTINNAKLNVLVNEIGIANYDIIKPSNEKTEVKSEKTVAFGLSVNSYSINNSTIKYNDKQGKLLVELSNFNHKGSGDFSQENSELETETSSLISFAMDGNSYAKNQKLQLDAILGIDLTNNKFTFLKNRLKLNKLPLIFDGSIQLNNDNQDININFKTPSSDFKNFLGLIPERYTTDITNVDTKGKFNVNGKVNGILSKTRIPKFYVSIQSENASFKYPNLPNSIENIYINAQIKNTTGKLDNTLISLQDLSFKIDEDIFSGKASVTNINTNPNINAQFKGVLNLENLYKAYPISFKNNLSGILKADLQTSFDMNAIKNKTINRIENNGKINLTNFNFSSDTMLNPIKIKETEVNFKPGTIALTKFNATTGKSDLNANGTLKNLLGALFNGQKLQGNLNLKSNALYLNDFMQESTEQTTEKEFEKETNTVKATSLKIPAFLDCKVVADANTVYYDNLKLKNVKGVFLLKNQKAILQDVNANVFNGVISLNGEVNTQNEQPNFALKLGVKSFDISESFTGLELLQSLSPIIGAMNGKLNSDIDLSGNLDTDFTPKLASLSGKAFAELLTTKIDPKKTKSLSLLNDKLSFINLENIDLSDIKTKLSFDNGNVVVKPFDVKYKDIGINIGGSHGFDKNMNYNITFNVPAKYLGNDIKGLLSKLSSKEQDITVPIIANITGNMKNPSVKTDLSSSVTKLSQKLIQQQKEKLISNTLSKLRPNKKQDSTKTTNDKKEKVRDILGNLFGKKKKKGSN